MKNQHADTATMQKTVAITRTFNMPVSAAWKAWTEPESFKKWWGPKDYSCPFCTIDLRVGGKNIASMKGPDGNEIFSNGIYREIVPMKKLVYEDNFADDKGNTVEPSYYGMPGEWSNITVTVTFKEKNGKTEMSMQQEGIPAEMYDDCITGWQQSFDKLEANIR